MDEYLNELIAYIVIGTVGLFIAAAGFVALRRRLRIARSSRRHRRSSARLAARPAMVVLPAETASLDSTAPGRAAGGSAPSEDRAAEPEPHGLEFFSAFEDRLARIRAEIEALDTTPTR